MLVHTNQLVRIFYDIFQNAIDDKRYRTQNLTMTITDRSKIYSPAITVSVVSTDQMFTSRGSKLGVTLWNFSPHRSDY
jgi:ATP-dependent protease HslVU (ClpYQ) peptidase subunit